MKGPFLTKLARHPASVTLAVLLCAFILFGTAGQPPPTRPVSCDYTADELHNLITLFLDYGIFSPAVEDPPPGSLPLTFEENLGQSDGRYSFLARSSGYFVFLAWSEATLDLRGKGGKSAGVIRTRLEGAGSASTAEPLDSDGSRIIYFLGNNPARWITGVPVYRRVKYRNVYPGIDVIYYGNGPELEYDFVIAPGADPRRIRLAFEGAERMQLDGEGALELSVGQEKVRWRKPLVYQTVAGARRSVEGRYEMGSGGGVTFQLGAYDRSRPLVIDPAVSFATYVGRSDSESAGRLALDATGRVYITGDTRDVTYPVTPGAFATAAGGAQTGDVVVTRLNAAGNAVEYSTHLGGIQTDMGLGVALDTAGNVYVTGLTTSLDFPTTPGAYQRTPGPANVMGQTKGDCFVAKLNPAGAALLYSTYLGATDQEACTAIAVDAAGNAYVTGATFSGNFPVTAGAFQTEFRRGITSTSEAFVSKLNPTGSTLVYSTLAGGPRNEGGVGIAVDAGGNAYVIGFTNSPTGFPTTTGAFQTTFRGAGGQPEVSLGDAFVLKLNPTGTAAVYSTLLGGTRNDTGIGIAVDAQGNAYVTGSTLSTDFPTTSGAFQRAYRGAGGEPKSIAGDAFVAKLNPAGSALVYSTYLGGTRDERGFAIAVDATGSAWVAGNTLSTDFPTTSDARQAAYGGEPAASFLQTGDAFVTQLNAAGSALVYSTYLGGSGSDWAMGVAVDNTGVVVAGGTSSSNFPTTTNAAQRLYGGSNPNFLPNGDAFVVRFGEAPTPPAPPTPTPTPTPTPPPTPTPTPEPAVRVNAVAHAASSATGAPGFSPSSIITLYGAGMATTTASAATTPLPTSLGGATLAINGRLAPLFYASPTQINAQLPNEIAPGGATAVVTVGGVASTARAFTVTAVHPGIFIFGENRAVVQNQDFSVNTADRPAPAGSFVTVYLTGIGPVDNPVPTGAVASASPLARVTLASSATIGGQNAEILFLGATPGLVGVGQANLRVPSLAPGTYPLVITIGGVRSNAPVVTVSAAN